MRLYYVVNARMPTDKAHGIQIAKMCEAFLHVGVEVVLVVPTRGKSQQNITSFYSLHSELPLVRLWVPDLYTSGKLGFLISSVLFVSRYVFFLLRKRMHGEHFLIYTVDMDTFSYAFLPLIAPTFAEMHSPKRPTAMNRFFFARVGGIIATTRATKEVLGKTFTIAPERLTVEPNGVSVAQFTGIKKEEARAKLSLPQSEKIAVYVGRLYGWKGLDVLPRAFVNVPVVRGYLVGGEKEELEQLTGSAVPENLYAVGVRPNEEIPLWLAAADALIVLGTSHNLDSMRYTSPMKVFEYMAANRPIVASRTEALQELLQADDAFWYEPDNADSLAGAILSAVRGEATPDLARAYDWRSRAARVVHFIEHAR